MKKPLLILTGLLLAWAAEAQTSREELLSHMELTAGNYANYPAPTGHLTPAPEGYEAFYISHYGRHGSRYMTSDKAYRRLRHQLDSARALGILTPLSQPLQVSANSSDSRRVMLSMAYFVNELKALNPSLSVSMDASQHDLYYIKSNKAIVVPPCPTDGMLYDKLEQFKHKLLSGEPQMQALFTDPDKARTFIDPCEMAEDLFKTAIDMYCLPELGIRFDDLFGEDGMIDGFRVHNASWCLWEGLMPGSEKSYYRIYPLLQNFLDEADAMIAAGGKGIRLRFGHDSIVLPFTFVLGFPEATGATDDMENLHKTFSIFRLIPMAANVQLVFFRKDGSDDILVKFLMNENETSVPVKTDCYPYYHWSDVSTYYRNLIEDAHLQYQTPEEDED